MVSGKCEVAWFLPPSLLHTHSLIAQKSWQFNEFTILLISSSSDWAVSSEWSQGETRHQLGTKWAWCLREKCWLLGDAGDRDDAAPCPGHFLHQAVSAVVAWLARWKWICIEPLWCNENIWQIFSHIWTLLLLKCVFLLGTLFSKIKL